MIHLFDIFFKYLSKCSNHSENPCKIINDRSKVERLGNTSGTNYKCEAAHIECYCIMEYGKSTHDNENTPTIMKKTNDNENIHPQQK